MAVMLGYGVSMDDPPPKYMPNEESEPAYTNPYSASPVSAGPTELREPPADYEVLTNTTTSKEQPEEPVYENAPKGGVKNLKAMFEK